MPGNLARFHAARARLYRSALELLRAPPSAETLERIRELLGGNHEPRALRELSEAIANATISEVAAEFSRAMSGTAHALRVCLEPAHVARANACLRSGVPGGDTAVDDIEALAVLADQLQSSLRSGDLVAAARLADVQWKLLQQHAGGCVCEFARRLERADTPFYLRLARAVRWQVEDDLALLVGGAA